MPTKTLKKAAAKPDLRLPTRLGGKCDHQSEAPCWPVDLAEHKRFHWPDEQGAVVFAMRQSRDLATDATVRDPLGNIVVEFHPRKYNPKSKPKPVKKVVAKKTLRKKAT